MPFQTYQDAEIASKIALDPDCDSLHIEPYNKFLGEDAGASSYIKKRLWDSAKPEQLYANGYANDYYERELRFNRLNDISQRSLRFKNGSGLIAISQMVVVK